MGFTALRDIARVVKIPFDLDPRPDDPLELTYEEFLEGVTRLEESGFPMEHTAEEAWPHFRGWRVNYERLVYDMADSVGAVPGPWSGPRRHLPGETIPPQRVIDRRPGDPEGVRPGRAGT